jgi:putative transposase
MTGRPGTERADPIAGDVRAVRRDGRERYGAGKIKAALEGKGRHRVQETHRRHHARTGHAGAYARGRSEPHGTRADEARLANLLDRGFDGYAPHTRPAGDLTYVRVGGDWAYVCLLVDLADRGIAGHSVGRARDAGLVLGAFAALDFPPADVQVFHADRGGEFDNTGIDGLLRVFGVKQSLSRKGDPCDNDVVESTNRLLRKELLYRNHCTTIEQLRRDPDDYVWWSDDQRLHSTLGYRSPKEFTEQGLVL